MAVKLIIPPAVDAVSLTEAKAHLRVVSSDEDTLISAYIKSAVEEVEGWTGRALIDQTWDLYLDEFPEAEIKIPKPPLIEVISIKYDDAAGVEQTVLSTDYYVDTINAPGWVVPNLDSGWPTPLDAINSVRVRFRAGYLSTDSPPQDAVPSDIKRAILLSIGSAYEYREGIIVGDVLTDIPQVSERLLRKHRVLLGMA